MKTGGSGSRRKTESEKDVFNEKMWYTLKMFHIFCFRAGSIVEERTDYHGIWKVDRVMYSTWSESVSGTAGFFRKEQGDDE